MSSRSIQIIGGPDRETAWVDAAKHALQVTGDLTIGSLNIGDAVSPTELVLPMGMVRDDALATLSDPEGDAQIARCNDKGALWVTLDGGISVGSLNIGEAVGAAENVTALGLQRDDVLATLSDPDGDAQIGRCNSRGALWVALDGTSSLEVTQATHDNLNANANIQVGNVDVANGNPVPVSDAGGSLTVDGTVAATQSGSWTVSVAEPVSVDDNGGSLTVDGTVAVSSVGGTVTVSGTVSVTEPVSVDDNGGSLTVDAAALVDSIAGATDTVFAAGAIRDDALATLTPADGDYVNLRTTNRGALWVEHDGTLDVNIAAQAGAITVTGTVSVTEPVSVDDNGGSLTVDGTVAATQSGSWTVSVTEPVSVDDNGGSLTVDGTVTVTQTTHDNLNLNANIQVGNADVANGNPVPVSDAGGSLTVDTALLVDSVAGATGVVFPAGAVRDDALTTLTPIDGDYVNLRTGSTGALWVVHSGVLSVDTALLVDSVAGATSAVFPAGAVRDDALATLTPADGDYVNLRTDSQGALWVRDKGDQVAVKILSGSTDGAPIIISGTAAGSSNTIHTADSAAVDRISLYASNVGGSGVQKLTLYTVDGSTNSECKYIVMPEQTVFLGIFTLTNSEVLKAYAGTTNIIKIFGEVERHTA